MTYVREFSGFADHGEHLNAGVTMRNTQLLEKLCLGLLAAATAAFGLAAAALADGMPRGGVKDVAPPPFSWTGIYVGGSVGVAASDSDTLACGGGTCVNPDGSGRTWGVQIGYNHQFSYVVAGIEASYSWLDVEGNQACATATFTCHLGVDKQMDVRGRLGIAADRLLVYGTAGWAWADVEGFTRLATTFSDGSNRDGPIYGGGIEIALPRNIIVGGEFLRADFGTETHIYDAPYRVPLVTDQLRFRVNFKF
jgi:outer membrane immunogenic protein